MDVEVVVRAQAGDQDAFTDIATALYSRLHRVAQSLLSDIGLAEDATQHTVLEMWRTLPQLRDPAKLEAWAHRILVNACRREGRKAKRWITALTPAPEEDPRATSSFSAVAHRDQLERAFRRLSPEQREVVVLHHYVSMPLREVADVLQIPTGTVHSRLNRAMTAMRAALEADDRLPEAPMTPREAAR